MNSLGEKEKKLNLALTKLKNLNLKNHEQSGIEDLNQKKNQLEIEKKELEDKYVLLKEDYERLGYSSDEILIHLLKLSTTPVMYGILAVLSAIIMFNLSRDKSLLFHIIIGILISVLIYYMNFIVNSLGNNGKIPRKNKQ